MRKLINDGWEFALGENKPLDDDGWRSVRLPHDWGISCPFNKDMPYGAPQGFRDRYGIGRYRRELEIGKIETDEIYRLYFDGVYENSTVWVNGHEAGGRKYGYSSFYLDVTDYINEGKNEIEVRVDCTSFPTDRWYGGAGIYRNVYFETLPKNHLERGDVFIKTKITDTGAKVIIETGTDGEVMAELAAEGKEYTASGSGYIEIPLTQYRAWSDKTPVLYPLTLTLKESGHSLSYRIGIREVKIDKTGLWVNGESTKLKGVCVHQDASCFGTAVPIEIWRERLLMLKEIGCNAIRPAHYIYAPEFLDLCDELGFYVYEECFDKWTLGAYGRFYETEWRRDIDTMVRRDRNRPSIIIWGIGNEVEFQGQPEMLKMLKNHCDRVRALDNTRSVTCALNPHLKREADIDISQIEDIQKFVDEADENEVYDVAYRISVMKSIAEIVDILALNYQEPWYETVHKALPDTPIIGTETYQYFEGYPVPMKSYTERNPWLAVEEHDYVIGGMIWTGFDYLGESMGWPAKGWSGALFGTDNEPRAGAYIMKSYWSGEPFVRFFVMDYSVRDEGVKEHWDIPRYVTHWDFPQLNKSVVPFMIASDCEKIKLILNGKDLFERKPADYPNGLVTGFIPYEAGEVKVIGINGGKEVCLHTVKSAGLSVRLEFDRPQIKLDAGADETLLLKVRAKDNEGTPVFFESAKVRFSVQGDAEIIGVDNGDILGFEPYNNTEIHMHRGKASAAVRVNRGAKRAKVTAYADGMYAGDCVISR